MDRAHTWFMIFNPGEMVVTPSGTEVTVVKSNGVVTTTIDPRNMATVTYPTGVLVPA